MCGVWALSVCSRGVGQTEVSLSTCSPCELDALLLLLAATIHCRCWGRIHLARSSPSLSFIRVWFVLAFVSA